MNPTLLPLVSQSHARAPTSALALLSPCPYPTSDSPPLHPAQTLHWGPWLLAGLHLQLHQQQQQLRTIWQLITQRDHYCCRLVARAQQTQVYLCQRRARGLVSERLMIPGAAQSRPLLECEIHLICLAGALIYSCLHARSGALQGHCLCFAVCVCVCIMCTRVDMWAPFDFPLSWLDGSQLLISARSNNLDTKLW